VESSLVNLNYGYNLASNRVWRQDTVAPSGGFDELYTYDSAQRLLKLERGDLNGGHNAISNQTLEQDWTLDPTGNWKSFTQDAPGTTDDVAGAIESVLRI